MMKYLKEIIKARYQGKKLPNLVELWEEYPKWKKYQEDNDVYKNAIPWITFWTIDYLTDFLSQDATVFEYGGGGSTLFFAKKVKELVTVEHNKEWFDGLSREMKKHSRVKWSGNFVEPEEAGSTTNLRQANPDHYFSSDEKFHLKTFRNYVSVIDNYSEEYFDVVLIDGRARPSCLKHSINKVKKNGLLILDNADRSYYLAEAKYLLSNYKLVCEFYGPTPYISWFTQTNIWKRIK